MKRRIFASGLFLLGGGLISHLFTKQVCGSIGGNLDPKDFALKTQGVLLQYVSQELLLKVFSHRVTDQDRLAFVEQIVIPNRSLFVHDASGRQLGALGFFRISE